MNRALPSLLALLLVLSLAVAPGMADSESATDSFSETSLQNQVSSTDQTDSNPRPIENTTNRLSLEQPSRNEYTEYGPDLGSALASADDELRVDQTQYAVIDREFDNASPDKRRSLLQDAYDQLTEQSEALEAREQRVVRAHANGEASNSELLQTLLRNYREASTLSEEFDKLEARSDLVSDTSLSVEDERDKLEMHRTEIRSQLESAAYGTVQTSSNDYIVIKTSEDGYVISAMDETYSREATRFDSRGSTSSSRFSSPMEMYQHAQEQYPWAYETGQSQSFNEHTTVQLYLFGINHGHGDLEAYLDSSTGDVYRETQVLDQEALPEVGPENGTTMVENGTRLLIEETAENGPVKVNVTNSETGASKPATILIDGFEVGKTSDTGSLWYVPSAGEYELTARTSTGDSISTTISSS